jgi:tetratricopeptide (TPR) repeat protein
MFGEQRDDVGRARSLSLLGRIVLDRGGEEAESLLRDAAELAGRSGAARWAADALHFLGILHGRRGDRRGAFRLYRRSRQAFLAAGDSIGAAYSLGAAGVDLWVLARRRVALRCMEKSQTEHLNLGERRGVGDGYCMLALFYVALGEPSEARRQAKRGLQMAWDTGSPEGMLTGLWAAAALAWQFGELDLARRCLQLRGSLPTGNSLIDSLRLDPAFSPLESLEPWGDVAASDTIVDEALALLEDGSQPLST